ncbi:MAG TPA: DUF1615 domain-containing protein [Xanthomonadales bacterium]|nr:DUF1615 domain-containing protein [Xanthomonadales bacterium]
MPMSALRRALPVAGCAALLLFAGCATEPTVRAPMRSPDEVRAQLVSLLPPATRDREGWATDIQSAFQLLDLPPSTENLCAVLAVTEQESTFTADPTVPGLAKIARDEIDRRAARFKVPQFAVRAALKLESPNGRTYGERIAAVRTERELSELFEDLIGRVPLGKRLFGDANPVRTGGPMQVSIAFAERHAARHGYPYGGDESIRRAVFTRRGGMYYGIAHLLDYPNSYERHLYRYADFNAGWYASRNAAFQAAVTAATGVPLALDGDLVLHERKRGQPRVGATEAAVRTLGPQLGLSDAAIRRALARSDSDDFERTALYEGVFALAERAKGRALPRAVMPRITLQSPKITRKLTTEWFATRVQARYQRCVNKAFGV